MTRTWPRRCAAAGASRSAAPGARARPATGRSSQSLPTERAAQFGQREDRSVTADEERAELAVATGADAAGHVPLECQPGVLGGDAAMLERARRGRHHPFRPAHEGGGPGAVPRCVVEQLGDDADLALPFRPGTVDVLLGLEQPVARGPRAEVQPDGAEARALGHDRVDQGPERCEADATGDDDDIPPDGSLD